MRDGAREGVGDEPAADANRRVLPVGDDAAAPDADLRIERRRRSDQDRLGALRLGMLDRGRRGRQPQQHGVGIGAKHLLERGHERRRILAEADRQQRDAGAARRRDHRLRRRRPPVQRERRQLALTGDGEQVDQPTS